MKEFRIVWKSLAGQADEVKVVVSENDHRMRIAFDAIKMAMASSDLISLSLDYYESLIIALEEDEKELTKDVMPILKDAKTLSLMYGDKEIDFDGAMYFFRTEDNKEHYDKFRTIIKELLFS